MTWENVEESLGSGKTGTLIIDNPLVGWHRIDVWWIPEIVIDAAAREGVSTIPLDPVVDKEWHSKDGHFERWCNARYFDGMQGVGMLIQATHSERQHRKLLERVERLHSQSQSLEVMKLSTGLVRMLD